jgi:hypothetical protein
MRCRCRVEAPSLPLSPQPNGQPYANTSDQSCALTLALLHSLHYV